jgi:hypothetical protein
MLGRNSVLHLASAVWRRRGRFIDSARGASRAFNDFVIHGFNADTGDVRDLGGCRRGHGDGRCDPGNRGRRLFDSRSGAGVRRAHAVCNRHQHPIGDRNIDRRGHHERRTRDGQYAAGHDAGNRHIVGGHCRRFDCGRDSRRHSGDDLRTGAHSHCARDVAKTHGRRGSWRVSAHALCGTRSVGEMRVHPGDDCWWIAARSATRGGRFE